MRQVSHPYQARTMAVMHRASAGAFLKEAATAERLGAPETAALNRRHAAHDLRLAGLCLASIGEQIDQAEPAPLDRVEFLRKMRHVYRTDRA